MGTALRPSTTPSAAAPGSSELDGDVVPFSLFFPDEWKPSSGLDGAIASLLGAGVDSMADSVFILSLKADFGVDAPAGFLEKKPKMLFWPLLVDCDEEPLFLRVAGLGVEISFPSIPRAIMGVRRESCTGNV